MRYSVFAFDYDGTLASAGEVLPKTYQTLQKLVDQGHTLALVTGRVISDLLNVFPQLTIFDQVIGENGSILYDPKKQTKSYLTHSISQDLITELKTQRIEPLSIGECIASTHTLNKERVSAILKKMDSPHHLILNGASLMILPQGISKGSGLQTYLKHINIPNNQVVCAGDAENDLDFFKVCAYRIAVQNAISPLKEIADFVTSQSEGSGVCEGIDRLFES